MAPTKEARTFDFQELAVWSTKLPEVTFAILPPGNNRSNPLATQETLYASVFAPGAICALDRERGKLIWRRELPKYSSASVLLHQQRLLAHTPTTLFALNPESGETLWLFRPYGDERESIYSSPSGSEKCCVYIGDRRGYLHCLDADSGKTIWKNLTNRAGGDVNSTPVLVHDLVIVSTNARRVLAYEAVSGKLAWEQELDGASTFGPVLRNRSLLVISDSLYALNPKSGKIQRRLSWSDRKVQQAVSTPRSIIVTLRPNIPRTEISATNAEAMSGSRELASKTTMCVIAQSGAERKRQIAVFCPEFRYEKTTRLVYLSHLGGVDILHPATGELVCQLTTIGDTGNGIGLVAVKDGNIYVLTGDGTVHALRHPAQFRAVSH